MYSEDNNALHMSNDPLPILLHEFPSWKEHPVAI